MNKFFIRLIFFFYFIKSKILKKKIYSETTQLNLFKKLIHKYNFKSFWFLNNFQIFEYFLPKSLNKKFNYLEIGTYEGLSLLYVLNKYKNINVTGVDIVNILNKKIKNHKNLKMFLQPHSNQYRCLQLHYELRHYQLQQAFLHMTMDL